MIIPPSVEKSIKKFPAEVRKKLYWCIDMLIQNVSHPSLRHKKIAGTESYWEFSITMNYRAVYRKEEETAYLIAIGKHEDIF